MIEKEIIKDQKETIHRLQKECTEKTELIEKLDRVIQDCNIQRTRLYKTLEEIKELSSKHNYWGSNLVRATELIYEITDKVNEALNNERKD